MGRLTVILAALLLGSLTWAQAHPTPDPAAPRFAAIDVFVETGDVALAAYQLDLRAVTGDVRIVGIEGGEHAEFADPPYYDPAAMQGDRVIIAAFSTEAADLLPTGRTRIATIHVRIAGRAEPEYEARLDVSATVGGDPLAAEVILETGQ